VHLEHRSRADPFHRELAIGQDECWPHCRELTHASPHSRGAGVQIGCGATCFRNHVFADIWTLQFTKIAICLGFALVAGHMGCPRGLPCILNQSQGMNGLTFLSNCCRQGIPLEMQL
jgi:hypothetical protein